jgi:hypothetical protein
MVGDSGARGEGFWTRDAEGKRVWVAKETEPAPVQVAPKAQPGGGGDPAGSKTPAGARGAGAGGAEGFRTPAAGKGAPGVKISSKKRKQPSDGTPPAALPGAMAAAAEDGPDSARKVSNWSKTPGWLKRNSLVEIQWGGEWWQAKALKCMDGRVLVRFVGEGAEEEWLAVGSARLRPPQDDWDQAFSGKVGEKVEVRRPNDKRGQRSRWHLAEVLEIAEGKVLVQYLERADVPNEWLPTDASHVRAVDDEAEQERRKELSLLEASKDAKLVEAAAAAAPASAPAPRARAGKRPAFPTGSPLVAGAHDCESVAASLLLFEFFSAFGASQFLSETPAAGDAGDARPAQPAARAPADLDKTQSTTSGWSLFLAQNGGMLNMKPDALLEAMAKADADNAVLPAVVSMVSALVRDLPDAEVPVDSLNLTAYLARLLERSFEERGRRMLKDKIEESFLSEDALVVRPPAPPFVLIGHAASLTPY